MANLIKNNLKPVTQGTIASLISFILIWAFGLVVTIVTTLSARNNGVPFYKAILLGGSVLLLVAFAGNLVSLAISRHKVGAKTGSDALKAEQAKHASIVEELNGRITSLSNELREKTKDYLSEVNQKEEMAQSRASIESGLGKFKTSYQWLHHAADTEKIEIDHLVVSLNIGWVVST